MQNILAPPKRSLYLIILHQSCHYKARADCSYYLNEYGPYIDRFYPRQKSHKQVLGMPKANTWCFPVQIIGQFWTNFKNYVYFCREMWAEAPLPVIHYYICYW